MSLEGYIHKSVLFGLSHLGRLAFVLVVHQVPSAGNFLLLTTHYSRPFTPQFWFDRVVCLSSNCHKKRQTKSLPDRLNHFLVKLELKGIEQQRDRNKNF